MQSVSSNTFFEGIQTAVFNNVETVITPPPICPAPAVTVIAVAMTAAEKQYFPRFGCRQI
jgi:hypothetical protein